MSVILDDMGVKPEEVTRAVEEEGLHFRPTDIGLLTEEAIEKCNHLAG